MSLSARSRAKRAVVMLYSFLDIWIQLNGQNRRSFSGRQKDTAQPHFATKAFGCCFPSTSNIASTLLKDREASVKLKGSVGCKVSRIGFLRSTAQHIFRQRAPRSKKSQHIYLIPLPSCRMLRQLVRLA